MPIHPRSFLRVLLALSFLLGARPTHAHLPIDSNLLIDVELNDGLLKIEPWLPTFFCPPLEEFRFENQDSWPNPKDSYSAIEDYFHQTCPVEIDGNPVRPKLTKLNLRPLEQAKHIGDIIDFVEARIVLEYQSPTPPQRMKIRWGIYPPVPDDGWGDLVDPDQDPQEFDMMMFVDKKEDFLFFSPSEPEFFWHRKPDKVEPLNVTAAAEQQTSTPPATEAKGIATGAIIAAALGCVFFIGATLAKLAMPIRLSGLVLAGLVGFFLQEQSHVATPAAPNGIDSTDAVAVFKTLQRNLYSAFDFESESQVYDVLAQSVDGDLLDDIYTEVYQSLLVVEKSSAVCRVHDVEVLACTAEPVNPQPDGTSTKFDIECHWRVHGLVKHFEHIHRRVNEYKAKFRLTLQEDGWRITAMAVSKQNRLDPKTMKPSEDYGL